MKLILSILFFLILGGFFAWMFGPGVVQDFQTDSANLQPTNEYSIEKASCRSKVFIVSWCDIELKNIADSSEKNFNYFLFSSMGGESVYPLVTPTGEVTTNIGMENLTNRIISLFLICLFLIGFALVALFRVLTGRAEA